ncbi:unnamed protein product [Albugo candida]|nr:unnamed protein product [Albugo candida]|eukprot:CCI49822.1 unnamed protein product [Albugo candida]
MFLKKHENRGKATSKAKDDRLNQILSKQLLRRLFLCEYVPLPKHLAEFDNYKLRRPKPSPYVTIVRYIAQVYCCWIAFHHFLALRFNIDWRCEIKQFL